MPWYETRPVNLFCLPYAGGSASQYGASWWKLIPPKIQICPVELPGRGVRGKEPFRTSLPELVAELADALEPYLHEPYALLGHSMGGVIATLLAESIERSGWRPPKRLFVFGTRPLHLPRNRPPLHQLDDAALVEHVRGLGGMSEALLKHPDFMQFLLRILRADLQLIESALPVPAPSLRCPLSVGAGETDHEAPVDSMQLWSHYTSGPFKLRTYPDGHFFPWSCPDRVLKDIEEDLAVAET